MATYRVYFTDDRGIRPSISRCDCWAVGVGVNSSRNEQISYRVRYSILGFGDNIRNPFERSP